MCVVLIAHRPVPEIDLMVLHNRDESVNRSFEFAQLRNGSIYGVDQKAGGTWLAADPAGRVAAVLNIRRPNIVPGEKSRGELPLLYLQNEKVVSRASYSPYNLLLCEKNETTRVFSSEYENAIETNENPWSMSNHVYGNRWGKETRLEKLFQSQVIPQNTLDAKIQAAFDVLANREKTEHSELPITGVATATEYELSSIYVELPQHHYQTVLSTVIVFQTDGRMRFVERNHLNGKRSEVAI